MIKPFYRFLLSYHFFSLITIKKLYTKNRENFKFFFGFSGKMFYILQSKIYVKKERKKKWFQKLQMP